MNLSRIGSPYNWPNAECELILKKIRRAANSETRLILIDSVVPYACRSSDDPQEDRHFQLVRQATSREAPAPLLANYGVASIVGYGADMVMMDLMNGQERTLNQLHDLLEASGWEIREVGQSLTGFLRPVVASPKAGCWSIGGRPF
ncbi:hypothetical protein BKA70DRAFT_1103517 [Coprinopsis sp. MPI-PUGE-AT-0042]|nr:hypothetical protein BKA70DRAFT_1103517 [Coprinopsis sp. MPI-PUGE-AT-0042]